MRYILTILLLIGYAKGQIVTLGSNRLTDAQNEYHSPGRGAQHWQGVFWDNSQAPQVPSGTSESGAKIGYIRFNWYEMETTQGTYTFTGGYPSMEWWLRYYMDMGQGIGFGGVMPVCGGCDAALDGGTASYPAYLHTLMQAEAANSKDWKASTNQWIPNWNSENYLSRLEALLDTIAKFLNTKSYTPATGPFAGKTILYKDVIEYMDIRGYGNFGEWHNAPYWTDIPTGRTATSATLKRIIDAHTSKFPNYPLVALAAAYDPGDASITPNDVTHYAATQTNTWGKIGWRLDAIGEYNHDSWLYNSSVSYSGVNMDTVIRNRWKYAPVTGEPINGGGQYATGGPAYYAIRSQIAKYHFFGFGNGNYPGGEMATAATRDTINNAFKQAGYKLVISGGKVPLTIYKNSTFTCAIGWKNLGSAPLYHKSRWVTKIELRTSGNSVVQTWTSAFDPFLFLPGSESLIVDRLALGNVTTGGGHKLVVYIQDSKSIFDPLYLGVNWPARNGDGSYTILENITIANPPTENTYTVKSNRRFR